MDVLFPADKCRRLSSRYMDAAEALILPPFSPYFGIVFFISSPLFLARLLVSADICDKPTARGPLQLGDFAPVFGTRDEMWLSAPYWDEIYGR